MVEQVLAARIELSPIGGWLVAGPLAALFVAALVAGYRITTRPVSVKVRRWLWGLRGGAAAVVIVLLVRPVAVEMKVSDVRPVLVVMEDDSRSMGIKDEAGGTARAAAMAVGLKNNEKLLGALAEKYDLAAYQFSDGLKQVVGAGESDRTVGQADRGTSPKDAVAAILAATPTMSGSSTRLGDCLRAAYEENRQRHLAGVLLLSDGASNLSTVPAAEAAQFLGRRGIPVYAVGYGSTEATGAVREIVAKNILAPATVFVGNRIEVTGDFVFYGMDGEKVWGVLSADSDGPDAPLQGTNEAVKVKGNRFEHQFRLPWTAKVSNGARSNLLTMSAVLEYDPVGRTPPVKMVNLETVVDSVEGGLKVLMVSGYLRPEGRFVAEALRGAGEFELEWIFAANQAEAARQVPVTAAQWGKFDAVIFDDLPRSYLSAEQLAGLVGAVGERGTGFLMIGGEHGFGPGGYAGTAVAGLLPVRMAAGEGEIKGPVKFRPTAAGIAAGILQLEKDKAASEKAWAEMPALDGAWKLGEAKSTAEVLARASQISNDHASASRSMAPGEADAPLLVAGQYQKGRVAALGVATTEQWQMEGHDEPPGKYFRRFWRQLVLHLTGREERRGNVWVATNEQRYSLPELQSLRRSVVATAGATDGQGNALGDAAFALTLSGPDGQKRAVTLARRGESWEATVEAAQAGDYGLDLAVTRGGKEVGKARTRFVVYEPDVEMEHPEADFAALAEVARLSGGKMVPARQLGEALEGLLARAAVGQVRVPERHSLWDNGWVLAIFVGLLGAEWVVRKRKGLV